MVKLVSGVGFNDADYNVVSHNVVCGKRVQVMCPYYRKWKGMLSRCYSEAWLNKYPTYVGCIVCDEWLTFSKFKAWMETQDWEGKQLDKDLLGDGKLYSPETCCFISGGLNKFLTLRANDRGSLPVGVSKSDGGFVVKVNHPKTGKLHYVGYYKDVSKAALAWKTCKIDFCNLIEELTQNELLFSKVVDKIKNYENNLGYPI